MQQTKHSAGYDLYAAQKKVIKSFTTELVRFDIYFAIPEGQYGKIVGRSGLANKHDLIIHNRTIDSDYRGVVFVIIFNFTFNDYIAKLDDRIAQLIFERYYMSKFVEVSDWDAFLEHDNERKLGGFGSTGK